MPSQSTTVIHSIPLYQAPSLNAGIQDIILPQTAVTAIGTQSGFLQIENRQGGTGFLPAAACKPQALGSEEAPIETYVSQPVQSYLRPEAGTQYQPTSPDESIKSWIILPDERLHVIGQDGSFTLIQRADGRLAYVPSTLCHSFAIPSFSQSSRHPNAFRLEYIVVGFLWGIVEGGWLIVWQAGMGMSDNLVFILGRIAFYVILLGALWFLGQRPAYARPFAIGIVPALCLIELILFLM